MRCEVCGAPTWVEERRCPRCTGRPIYFDKTGTPITPRQYMDLKWNPDSVVSDYSRIGKDTVGDAEVSTVWLGLNHAFTDESPPVLFETLIFGGEYADEMMRYCTEDEAREGHARVVADLRAGRAPWWLRDGDGGLTRQ